MKIKNTYCQWLMIAVVFISISISPIQKVSAQDTEVITRILFIMDGSRSMLATWGNSTKFSVARQLIYQIADSVDQYPTVQTGLRLYGHQTPHPYNDCNDTKLEVKFKSNNGINIKTKLNNLFPQGVTPISLALREAMIDFGEPDPKYRNIVILLTDGAESCGNNPCEVILEMKQKGIITKSFVLGLDISDEDELKQLECMGEYMNMLSPSEASKVVSTILGRVFNSTTVRIDLLDKYQRPTETDLMFTLFDSESGKFKYNYYHTLSPKGVPDTITVDPTYGYNLKVHTRPSVEKNDIYFTPFEYNVVSENTPQGDLRISVRGESQKKSIQCIVKQDGKVIEVQPTGSTINYLVGKYEIEILTLPIIKINSAEIEQDNTTTIEISSPGFITFIKAQELYGGIYMYSNNKWVEIFELSNKDLRESLALQPGKYKVIYRYKNTRAMTGTKEIDFEIITGTSTTLKL
ncbi:MAG: VWA domain-containing protein [Bacteroidetes bacterium]|nr:VWA domain-containing protein [Bacteroidota bacterium]